MRHGIQFTDPSSTRVTRTLDLPLSAAGSGDACAGDTAVNVDAFAIGSDTGRGVECPAVDFLPATVVSTRGAAATVLPATVGICTVAIGWILPVFGWMSSAAV